MTSTLHHNPKHSRRVAELDVLRGLAITAVVGLHVTWAYLIQAPLDRPEGKAVAVLHLLTGFGVPLFLILSGTGLALRYSQAMKWRDYRGFLYRRALRLLPAYVTWSLVVAAHADPALLWPPSRLVSLLLTGSAGPQFYFIPLLCQFYILWPLLRPLAVAAAASCRQAVAITAVATALSLAWWQASAAGLIVANTLTLTGFWLLYMVAGLALAPHLAGLGRARARHFALVGTLATVAAAIMFSGFFGMIAPPYPVFQLMLASVIFRPASMAYTYAAISLALLLAFSLRPGRTAALLAGLGQHSYGIYLVHLLVLGIIVNRIIDAPAPEQFGHTLWIFRITASWTLCLLLSYAAVRLMSSVPGLRVLVGSKTAR